MFDRLIPWALTLVSTVSLVRVRVVSLLTTATVPYFESLFTTTDGTVIDVAAIRETMLVASGILTGEERVAVSAGGYAASAIASMAGDLAGIITETLRHYKVESALADVSSLIGEVIAAVVGRFEPEGE